jgi:hypothetical protein
MLLFRLSDLLTISVLYNRAPGWGLFLLWKFFQVMRYTSNRFSSDKF